MLGKEHPDTLRSVNNLAALYFVSGDWGRAAQLWRQSTAAIARREQLGASDAGLALTGKRKSEAEGKMAILGPCQDGLSPRGEKKRYP